MVIFNKLECDVNCENGELYIDISVPAESYLEDIRISRVLIDNQDTLKPSVTPRIDDPKCSLFDSDLYTRRTEEGLIDWETAFSSDVEGDNKHIVMNITREYLKNIYLSSNVFYVWVITEGVPGPETPCGEDCNQTLGVMCDIKLLYDTGIKFISELSESCAIPKGFIDFILNYNAFKLAIEAKEYTLANEIINRILKCKRKPTIVKCSCHGK